MSGSCLEAALASATLGDPCLSTACIGARVDPALILLRHGRAWAARSIPENSREQPAAVDREFWATERQRKGGRA